MIDPTYPYIYGSRFEERGWKTSYGEVKGSITPDSPKALGKEFLISEFMTLVLQGVTPS